jgi:transcriptional regulator with XRE-family HTH domain
MTPAKVLLPLMLPDTKSLRRAAANILRDIQREHEETDQATADRIGISVGTIRNIRNEQSDISSLTLARIGAAYGGDAIRPYEALYASGPAEGVPAIQLLADAIAAMTRANGPKGECDALPVIRDCIQGLEAWALMCERKRLRVVA